MTSATWPSPVLHPRKRFRPVAAGDLAPGWRSPLKVQGRSRPGLAACLLLSPLLGLVALAYVALTLSYTLVWRHLVVFDIVAVAGGFVLRAIAGGVAADVHLSDWFIAVVTLAAVLVATGKRRAELLPRSARPEPRRRVLAHYTGAALQNPARPERDRSADHAYYLWAFEARVGAGIPWRVLTIVPFAAAIVRYGRMLRGGDGNEAPEDMLFGRPRAADRVGPVAGAVRARGQCGGVNACRACGTLSVRQAERRTGWLRTATPDRVCGWGGGERTLVRRWRPRIRLRQGRTRLGRAPGWPGAIARKRTELRRRRAVRRRLGDLDLATRRRA